VGRRGICARAFVRNIPGPDKIAGFYMGPDGFIWGRNFLGINGHAPRELVMKKQWYSFLLWGRLSYEPGLPDENFGGDCGAPVPRGFGEAPDGGLGPDPARDGSRSSYRAFSRRVARKRARLNHRGPERGTAFSITFIRCNCSWLNATLCDRRATKSLSS
jgi:hypothetical protein